MLTVNHFNSIDKNIIKYPVKNQNRLVFILFCLWTFVILCRPQDILPVIKPLRPALLTGILTLSLVVIRFKEMSGPTFFHERQVKYFMTLLLIMISGIPFSLYARFSFMTIFTEYINVIIFFFIFYKVVDSVDKLYILLLLGCLGNGLYSAYSVSKGTISSGRLFFGTMFDPNDLAYFAIGFLPLNLIFMSRDNPLWVRLASFCSFGSGLLMILLTGSRGGLLGLGIALFLLLFLSTKTFSFSFKVIIVSGALVIFTFSPINADRLNTLFSLKSDYNLHSETGRLAIWRAGVRIMFDNPITGVGVNCFNKAIGMDRVASFAETNRWQTAHNSLVQIGTETGILGLFMFVLLSLNAFSIFNKTRKIALNERLAKIGEMGLVGFSGLFISGMFLSQAYSFYWALYIVMSASVSQMLVTDSALIQAVGDKSYVK